MALPRPGGLVFGLFSLFALKGGVLAAEFPTDGVLADGVLADGD